MYVLSCIKTSLRHQNSLTPMRHCNCPPCPQTPLTETGPRVPWLCHPASIPSTVFKRERNERRIQNIYTYIYIYIYMYIVNNEYMIYYMYTVYIYVFIDKLRKHSWGGQLQHDKPKLHTAGRAFLEYHFFIRWFRMIPSVFSPLFFTSLSFSQPSRTSGGGLKLETSNRNHRSESLTCQGERDVNGQLCQGRQVFLTFHSVSKFQVWAHPTPWSLHLHRTHHHTGQSLKSAYIIS